MKNATVRITYVLAFLLTGLLGACGQTRTAALVPTVIATAPANGSTGIPDTQVITARFNETMNATTITTSTFTVTGTGGVAVTGAGAYSGTTATFTPTAVLATSTLFTATISTGAKDPTGAPLATNFVWTFTSAPPPTVISTVPANGATGVALNTTISATF